MVLHDRTTSRGWAAGVKALERGTRSVALTPTGPHLCSGYSGNVILSLAFDAWIESPRNLEGASALLLDWLGGRFLFSLTD
jgi:hypothetical protein